mgnify:CR=1 FL=1
MKIISTLIVLTITSFAYSQTIKSQDLLKYISDSYKVEYPSSWRIDTSKQGGIEFAIFSPKESADDKFLENINLIIQNLSGKNIDLDKYAAISEEQIKSNAVNLKAFNMVKLKKGISNYYKLTYEMTYGNFRLFTEQYYFIRNEEAFVITFSSETGKSKDMGEEILSSFTLLN